LTSTASHPASRSSTAFVESFNGRVRDERVNEDVVATLPAAPAVIERWRLDYSHVRPHPERSGLMPEAVGPVGSET
jgi:putative transposase